LKTKRNLLAATILAILLVSLTAPAIALSAFASEDEENNNLKIVPVDNWYKLESDLITVLFPRGGQKPMFIWWYTQAPDQIYVVKFKGLIEWFAFDHPILPKNPEYYNHLRNASSEIWRDRFENMYFKPEENLWMGNMMRLMLLRQIVNQIMERMSIETEWHRPFFPFDAGRWNLTKPSNITTPEGTIIGVSFAFKLDKVSDLMPGFKFAENNIMIRVRFYNTTVQETDPNTGYKYTVNAGEMKMDFVVNKWVWNIDAIKEFIADLKANGFDVNIPEGKSRLALWVNLASINITKLQAAEEEPEQIEGYSTATHMDVDGMHEDIRPNMTLTSQEKPIEINRPVIKLGFANETKTLGGFFQFVSSAKVKESTNLGDAEMVPVKAAYIAAGAHMRLFIGYPYFGNGTLEHDPSIGVDAVPSVETTPQYTVQNPSGINAIDPAVIGKYALPLFTLELAAVLVGAASIVAIIIYAVKWKKKTPINMVGAR
jgi:hypothetical protein